jgi:hypothetical protein
MKNLSIIMVFLLAGLLFFAVPASAQAPYEMWATDPATGGKICVMAMAEGLTLVSASWSGPLVSGKAEGKGTLNFTYKEKNGTETKAQADGEMKAGKLDGRISIKWSDGDMFDGDYKAGLRDGKGLYKWASGQTYDGDWKASKMEGKGVMKLADGRTYEGDFKAGQQEGYGVGRGADGQVIHDGQWKDGMPVLKPKTDKVLGIPWGATQAEVDAIMKARPSTFFLWVDKRYTPPARTYGTKYNGMDAFANVFFHQDKMYRIQIIVSSSDDKVAQQFAEIKAGLTERYGKPFEETGKYLDSQATFDLGANYAANLAIGTHQGIYKEMPAFRCVAVAYYHGPTV